MNTKKTTVALSLGILSGLQILVTWFLKVNFYWILLGFFIAICVIKILKWEKKEFIIFFVGVVIGLFRIVFWDPGQPIFLTKLFDTKIQCVGRIISFPERREENMIYDVKVEMLNEKKVKSFGVRITTHQHIKFVRGEKISFYGKLEEPFESNEFSYKQYLSRKYIFSTMRNPYMEKIEDTSLWWEFVGNMRYSMQNHIQSTYQYPYGGFLEGLLLGRRYGLSPELSDVFQVTGLTHIIAISGYNITLIIMIMANMFGFLGRYAKVLVCSVAVIIFTILVGAEAAVVRACLMGLVALGALWFGRQSFVWTSLLLAGVFMTYMEPRTFLFDVGFQLSVVATIGVVALSDMCMKWFKFLPKKFEIRDSFAITIAAQITTLPLLIYYFNNISIVSPIANVVAAPFLPWAMFFGFLESVLSFIPVVSHLLLFITQGLLKIVVFLATLCSKVPFAQVQTGEIPVLFVLVGYVGIFYWLMRREGGEVKSEELRVDRGRGVLK